MTLAPICRVCRVEIEQPARGRPRQYCGSACADYAHALTRLRRAALALVKVEPALSSRVASDAFVLVHESRCQARDALSDSLQVKDRLLAAK
tara:strand:- start:4 stop:279 length:276 start_codon:yes stop_codon:yes gene_type:complete